MNRRRFAIAFLGALSVASCGSKANPSSAPVQAAVLPDACPAGQPANQSPAKFGEGGIAVDTSGTCDTAGSEWVACHQHMHCGPEHTGEGICGGADCEVHTVHRRRRDGRQAAPVAKLHNVPLGDNCEPAEHDLMVRSTFLDFENDCDEGAMANLTYCGSATGNNHLDADNDGVVTCEESGVNPTAVRWCIQTACECHPGKNERDLEAMYGEIEATRDQGCPSAVAESVN